MAEKEEPQSIIDTWKKGDPPIIIDGVDGPTVIGDIKTPKVTDTQRKNTDKMLKDIGFFDGIDDEDE